MLYIYGAGKRSDLIKNLLVEIKSTEKFQLIDDNRFKSKKVLSKNYLLNNYNYLKDTILIAISNPIKKYEIFNILRKKINLKLHEPLISPSANIKKNSFIGKGSVIMDNAYISQNVKIKRNCFVGIKTLISHDSEISDFVDISHNVSIAGNVKIKKSCYVGMGASIVQNLTIEENSFIGAKVLIKKNIKKNNKITLKQNLTRRLIK